MPSRLDLMFAEEVMVSGQLASILEVSGYPKPGNIHRTRDLPDVRYEHFLAGAVALGPSIREAAIRGMRCGIHEIPVEKIEIGYLIKRAVEDVKGHHKGGNTHLGTCILLIPLAASAGKTHMTERQLSLSALRKNVIEITSGTTPMDAVHVYEAIKLAETEKTLGVAKIHEAPDLYEAEAEDKLLSDSITLFQAMEAASGWDTVASEFVNGMRVAFEVGYPSLIRVLKVTGDINVAIVHCFLTILSEVPDTFIARKVGLKRYREIKAAVEKGLEETRWISEEAGRVLHLGGLTTEEGRLALLEFDDRLHEAKGTLSPGTTADITAASLMAALLLNPLI